MISDKIPVMCKTSCLVPLPKNAKVSDFADYEVLREIGLASH